MKTVGILSAGVKVQQKAYDGCERSAEDAHFSMTPDPNLKRSVCSAPFMLVFFWTFDLENCSLSPHFFYSVVQPKLKMYQGLQVNTFCTYGVHCY